MSLDVYLTGEKVTNETCCYVCGAPKTETYPKEFFSANITHNLHRMANEAGIGAHLWAPEELGITKAKDLIEPLEKGLADMKARPEYYEQFNAKNGWGMYIHFVPWIEEYLQACKDYPDADVSVSR